ncbi:MAG TPA: hypothetical protein PLA68_02175 [Panacibacter sp.]|nr:hypothetical protein [Panacibacter sp.]
MKYLFIVIILVAATAQFCTAQYMQLFPWNTGTYDKANSNDLLIMGQSDEIDMDNSEIGGNPFWNEEWKTALLYTGDYKILIAKVKLNLYKNNVWYTTPEGIVMFAKTGQVKAITFFNGNDTSSILANFVYLKNDGDKNARFYQVMNGGKTELVKLDKVTVNKGLYDPFTGKTEMNYKKETAYFLYQNGEMPLLKNLGKEAVFSILKTTAHSAEWLNKNRNKLKSEAEIVHFLNYLNAENSK